MWKPHQLSMRKDIFVSLLVQNYQVASTFDISRSLKTNTAIHKEQAAREWRSFLRIVSLFHCFFASTFSIEFICRSHLSRGTCIMDGSRVLNPSFLILRVPFCSPRPTCVSRTARPSPSRWQFPIPIALTTVSLALSDKHEEISQEYRIIEKLSWKI